MVSALCLLLYSSYHCSTQHKPNKWTAQSTGHAGKSPHDDLRKVFLHLLIISCHLHFGSISGIVLNLLWAALVFPGFYAVADIQQIFINRTGLIILFLTHWNLG